MKVMLAPDQDEGCLLPFLLIFLAVLIIGGAFKLIELLVNLFS